MQISSSAAAAADIFLRIPVPTRWRLGSAGMIDPVLELYFLMMMEVEIEIAIAIGVEVHCIVSLIYALNHFYSNAYKKVSKKHQCMITYNKEPIAWHITWHVNKKSCNFTQLNLRVSSYSQKTTAAAPAAKHLSF